MTKKRTQKEIIDEIVENLKPFKEGVTEAEVHQGVKEGLEKLKAVNKLRSVK